jgi:hypothetical protein
MDSSIRQTGEQRLQEAIRRFNRTRRREVTVDERPGCVFGLLTRDRIEDVGQALDEVRQELIALKKLLSGIFVALTLTFIGVLIDLAIRAAALR